MKNLINSAFGLLALGQVAAFAQTSSSLISQPASRRPAANPAIKANFAKLPLSFEANQGQTDGRVKFLSRGQGYSLFLTDREAVLALHKNDPQPVQGRNGKPTLPAKFGKTDVVRMELDGASHGLRVIGEEPLPGKSNYFIGSDPAKWRTNVPTYSKVKYTGVYPGIDLVYYGNQQQLEYDFVVAPNADPKQAKLHFAGASKLKLNHDGDLEIIAKDGEIAFHKPIVYQMKDGQRQPVDGSFKLLAKNTVGFELGSYDRSRELVVDPTLGYSTYLGAFSDAGIAVDDLGNTYVTGVSGSPFTAFVTDNAIQPEPAAMFITKVNPAGTALIYSTYFGGNSTSGYSTGSGIALDHSGNVYVSGTTTQSDFPITSGAYRSTLEAGKETVFVTKLNGTGSAIVYSTFIGGAGGAALAVDQDDNAYIAGATSSADYPVTAGAFQTLSKGKAGTTTGFITKLNAIGTALIYSTFLGGSSGDWINSVAVDGSRHAYVTGYTLSKDFPTTPGAFQRTAPFSDMGSTTIFAAKLNIAGSELSYSTFLKGSVDSPSYYYDREGFGIAVDAAGDAYLSAIVSSLDFPISANAFQKVNHSANGTGVIAELNPAGSALLYSTYLGGSRPDFLYAIAVDSLDDAWVTGWITSRDFPVTGDASQNTNNGLYAAACLSRLNPSGSALIYSTYLGGTFLDFGTSIAIDRLGNAYVVGNAGSIDFPVTAGAFHTQNASFPRNGTESVFAAEFVFNGATTTSVTSNANPQTIGQPVTLHATVAPVSGTGVPAGTVAFITSGAAIGHGTLNSSGEATFTTSDLPVGENTIVASYEGQPGVFASSTQVTSQSVAGGQVATPIFPRLGATYVLPVPVEIITATSGATIYYTTDGSTPSASSTKYTGPFTVSSTTTVKAIAEQSGNAPSGVAVATFTIAPNAIHTAISVVASANPSTLGDPVSFTATVKANSGAAPTGSVVFKDYGVVIGSVPLTGATATITTSALTAGAHEISAVYLGNETDFSSESTIGQRINQ